MPRTSITADIPGGGAERPPILKMSAKGEVQRLALWDIEVKPDGSREISPWFEWVHNMKAPEVKDGVALKEKVKGKDGSETLKWKLAFVGAHICLGDGSVLAQKGMDPANCPTCEAVRRNRDLGGWAAELRYAMNVIRYSIRPDGYALVAPPSAQILPWAFPVSRMRQLRELSQKVANDVVPDGRGGTRPKSLMDVDILLGPCEDPGYQRYPIDRLDGPPAWAHPQVMSVLQELWFGDNGANRFSDEKLQAACGRIQTNRAYLEADIRKGEDAWNTALHAGAVPAADPMAAAFQGNRGLAEMNTSLDAMAQQAAQLGQPQAAPVADPFSGGPGVAQPAAAPAAAGQPAAAAPVAPGVVDPFAPQGQALQQAAAPEMAQMAAQQQAALAAAGAPVAAPVQDPFGGHGLDQFGAQPQQLPAGDPFAGMQPAQPVPPTAAPASSAPAPGAPLAASPAVPTQAVPGAALPTPQPSVPAVPADPFAVTPPAQQAPANGAVSFDQLTNFGNQGQ